MEDESLTHVSLLYRLRDDHTNSGAWNEFVKRYGPRIHQWCERRGLQPHDAEDVTQNVLMKMAQTLSTFEYDANQTFRGWLWRTTDNAISDYVRGRFKAGGVNRNIADLSKLDGLEARKDLLSSLEKVFDLELLELAMARVRTRVEEHRWRAWEMTAQDRIAANEVAEKLNMKVPTVYSCRHQVQKLIAEEVRQLENKND